MLEELISTTATTAEIVEQLEREVQTLCSTVREH